MVCERSKRVRDGSLLLLLLLLSVWLGYLVGSRMMSLADSQPVQPQAMQRQAGSAGAQLIPTCTLQEQWQEPQLR
ncbi:hypothetical protein B0T13DRAFT_461323 [Neurospora crassa]|nr:hypothetical protein B0T13DRAFT_461323 [Neurospora crassa]